MELSEYENIFQNEETHFYYRAVQDLICSLIEKYVSGEGYRILEVGCGTGLLAKKLGRFGQVEALDISEVACALSRKRGISAHKASADDIPFKEEIFDILVSVDVLYHQRVANDDRALADMARVLKPGGILILRVPAISWLRSNHDKHVHTRERYDRRELRSKLVSAGFEIQKLSFVGLPLLPFGLLKHLAFNRGTPSGKSGVRELPHFMNHFLYRVLKFENSLVVNGALPLGLGLVAVGRKP